uniref:Putative ovule protein n=1 Tax=Solanum chacoense TaxID=4108 RepID=A0A0V0HE10_SOLCH
MDWAIVHATSKAMQAEVYRMNLSGAMYFIWQERNCRIFQHKEMTTEVIIRNIIREIHCRGTG